MRKITKRSAIIITAAVVGIGGAGAAWAFSSWGDGSATVNAKTSTIQPLTGTVTLADDADHRLYPGHTIGVSNLHLTNNNDYAVSLTGATVDTVTGGSGSTCDKDKAALSTAAVPTGIVVSKGGSDVSIPNFLTMNAWASPECAGTTLTVTLALTGNAAS